MVDVSAIAGAMSSLNAAVNITKAIKDLKDWSVVQTEVIELQRKILEAQSALFSANEERAALIEKIREAEKRITDLETWHAERQRYKLAEIGAGAFAHVLKESMRHDEPIHCICSDCYQRGEKSLLQMTRNTYGSVTLACPRCEAKVEASEDHPDYPLKREYAPDPKEKARAAMEPCPICSGGRLEVTKVSPHPVMGDLGLQERTLKCDNSACGHTEARMHDPQGHTKR